LKMRRLQLMGTVLLLLLISGLSASAALSNPPPQPPPPPALIEELQRQTEGKVRISYHAETGMVRFIGTDPAHPIPQPAALVAEATPEEAARQFLATYGRLFGLTNQANELTVMSTKSADRGRSFVRFQQVYQGVPVMGGELIVQVDAQKNVLSANGEVLPDLAVDVAPTIDAETARQTALGKVAKDYGLSVADLTATDPELWIYNPILLGGPGLRFNALVWRMDVEPKEPLPIRELVLIDAHLGAVALHFNQIDTAKYRIIYDNQNDPAYGLPGYGPVRTEGQGASAVPDVNYAYDYAGDTYDFYATYHGRDSINNAGMNLISTVRYCEPYYPCPYENAFWNGSQMVYGEGYCAADDVVAHEMTHGVTQYESNLFYYYQSGAINESFSDMWGEFVDQTNGAGNDASGVRWLIGEDLPIGAIRDMSNPHAYSQPDRMGDTSYYYCGEADQGGVHYNSGVGNKAAYLLVDGQYFNGYDVTGIGLEKTAKIFYEVQTNIFTSASDYADLYDNLYQACTNLIGTSGITAADCLEVQDAVDATEMDQQPSGCPATEAPVCTGGVTPFNLFFDDMENTGSGNWTHAAITGSDEWYYPQTANPYGFDATYATSGVYNLWGYDQSAVGDYYIAMTLDVALPSGTTAYMHFNHSHGFEDDYDGGIIQYSTNSGGSWSDVPLGWFTHTGYNGTISNLYGNPLGGKQAFVDDSHGYYSSRMDLSSLAGQNVRFRFRIGTDVSYDDYGWFIDDARIYTCEAVSPQPDLIISDITWAPASPQQGDDIQFTVYIRNQGTADTNAWGPFDVQYYIDEANLGEWILDVAAGTTDSRQFTWTATSTGSHTVRAYADQGGFIPESDETNNERTEPFSVSSLAPTYIYLPLVLKGYSPPPPPGPFYSVADACVLQGYPTTNLGSTVDMWAGYDDYLDPDGKIARSLIKFDLSAIPTGTPIDSALLQVYLVSSWDFPGRTRTITSYGIGSAWSESSVTWNTRPSYGEAYGSAPVTHGAWGWYSFDVTNLARGWINGAIPNNGVMLRGPEWSGWDSSWKGFSTREGPYPPKLVITYTGYPVSGGAQVGGESLGIGEPAHIIIEALTGLLKSRLPSADLCPNQPPGEKCLALQ